MSSSNNIANTLRIECVSFVFFFGGQFKCVTTKLPLSLFLVRQLDRSIEAAERRRLFFFFSTVNQSLQIKYSNAKLIMHWRATAGEKSRNECKYRCHWMKSTLELCLVVWWQTTSETIDYKFMWKLNIERTPRTLHCGFIIVFIALNADCSWLSHFQLVGDPLNHSIRPNTARILLLWFNFRFAQNSSDRCAPRKFVNNIFECSIFRLQLILNQGKIRTENYSSWVSDNEQCLFEYRCWQFDKHSFYWQQDIFGLNITL